ncbi:ribosome biogenesis protein SLX9-domain-containing protein [Halenospora varia]|nr:ribosome biogenesis protein SLX9-domain-containing protein [Halenospora varia]
MAPTAPKKRPSMRSKTPRSGSGLMARPPPSHREGAIISDSFISSKKDKRTIKHSAFVNRIEKAHKKPLKRRRPSKKLVTTMEGLADALPDIERQVNLVGDKKIKMDSLTNGPGLMKRRGKVEAVERERFGKNLAQLMGAQQGATVQNPVSGAGEGEQQPSSTAKRFQALRAWIGQTMEKEKAFEETN